MSNFSEKEVEFAKKWGNRKAFDWLMAEWSKTMYPEPQKTDLHKVKEFMRMKYTQKRFVKEDSDDSSDSDKKKKKKKKDKKPKKTHKKKKGASASEEE
jgi:hypothetical protein